MNKPTIGRIVLYQTTEQDRQQLSYPKVPGNPQPVLPAVVVAVWSDTTVNLKVIGDSSADLWKTSVTLGTDEGTWQWPVIPSNAINVSVAPTGATATATVSND